MFSGAIAVGGEVSSGVVRCLTSVERDIILIVHSGTALWRIFAIRKHIVVGDIEGCEVSNVEMPVDFLEAAILVTEVAAFTVGAELLTIELTAVLRLILIVRTHHLRVQVCTVALRKLLLAMSVLALGSVAAEASLGPVLAHLTLVHGALDETLASHMAVALRHEVSVLAILLNMCWTHLRNFDWRQSGIIVSLLLRSSWDKSMRLLHVHGLKRVQFGWGWDESLEMLLLRLGLLAP